MELATNSNAEASATADGNQFVTVPLDGEHVCRICQCDPDTCETPTPTNSPLPMTCLAMDSIPRSGFSQPEEHDVKDSLTSQNDIASLPYNSPIKERSATSDSKQSEDYALVSACLCNGSLKYVHQHCIQTWIKASGRISCELCKQPYQFQSRFKPLRKWRSLPKAQHGQNKWTIRCALFQFCLVVVIMWIVCGLNNETVNELLQPKPKLGWKMWIRIFAEIVGTTGSAMIISIRGRAYMLLMIKWIRYNRNYVVIGK